MAQSIQQLQKSVGESQTWCEEVISKLSEAQRLEFDRRARLFSALKAQYLQVHEQLVLRENDRRAEYRFAVPVGLMILAGIAIFREMNFEMMGIAVLIVGLLIGLEQSLWKIEAKQSWLAITGIEKELSVIGVSLNELIRFTKRETRSDEVEDLPHLSDEERQVAVLEGVLSEWQIRYRLIRNLTPSGLPAAPRALLLMVDAQR